jgi:hypothetical protein
MLLFYNVQKSDIINLAFWKMCLYIVLKVPAIIGFHFTSSHGRHASIVYNGSYGIQGPDDVTVKLFIPRIMMCII